MNKKASAEILQLAYLIDIIIGVIVAFSLIGLALTWNSLSRFNEIYIKEDLSLLLDTVLSSPNDIKIVYPISDNYKIQIIDNKVDVLNEHNLFSKDSQLVINYNRELNKISVKRVYENE